MAIVRLVGALMLEQNGEWQVQRRYVQLEGLKTVCDNQMPNLCRSHALTNRLLLSVHPSRDTVADPVLPLKTVTTVPLSGPA